MRTIFALFKNYEEGGAAVEELLEKNFDKNKMNVIAQELVVKNKMTVKFYRANVAITDKIGDVTARGLDRLFGGEQPVRAQDVGEIYAGGDMATILAKSASDSGILHGGLKKALMEIAILPEKTAEAYKEGVKEGGVLFWIQTSNERAPEAANILHTHKGIRY